MLIFFHGGDILDTLIVFAIVIFGFIVIFICLPLIFIIRDWQNALKERRDYKKEKESKETE